MSRRGGLDASAPVAERFSDLDELGERLDRVGAQPRTVPDCVEPHHLEVEGLDESGTRVSVWVDWRHWAKVSSCRSRAPEHALPGSRCGIYGPHQFGGLFHNAKPPEPGRVST